MANDRKSGRERKYCDTYPALALAHMSEGGSRRSLADELRVDKVSIGNWTKWHPEFNAAVLAGEATRACRLAGLDDPPLPSAAGDGAGPAESPASWHPAALPPHRPAPVFEPLCPPARYKGAWGGRESHAWGRTVASVRSALEGGVIVRRRSGDRAHLKSARCRETLGELAGVGKTLAGLARQRAREPDVETRRNARGLLARNRQVRGTDLHEQIADRLSVEWQPTDHTAVGDDADRPGRPGA